MRSPDDRFLILVCGDDQLWTAAIRVAMTRSAIADAIRVVAAGGSGQYRKWVEGAEGLVAVPIGPERLAETLPLLVRISKEVQRFEAVALLDSAWPDPGQRIIEQAAWEAGISLSVRGRRNCHRIAHLAGRIISNREAAAGGRREPRKIRS